jgi:hypothetical protein
MVFSATFNTISVILWRSVLLVEETGGPRENHQPVASHWIVTAVGRVWIKWGKGGEFRQILKKTKILFAFKRLHLPFQKWGICLHCATVMIISIIFYKENMGDLVYKMMLSASLLLKFMMFMGKSRSFHKSPKL